MLDGYIPLIDKYQELWAQYLAGQLTKSSLPFHVIMSQEEAVNLSLKIQLFLEAASHKSKLDISQLKRRFRLGQNMEDAVAHVTNFMRIAEANLAGDVISEADRVEANRLIDECELWFNFKDINELFLEEDNVSPLAFE